MGTKQKNASEWKDHQVQKLAELRNDSQEEIKAALRIEKEESARAIEKFKIGFLQRKNQIMKENQNR